MKYPPRGVSYFWQQTAFCSGVNDCSGIPVVYYKPDNHFSRQHKNTSWLYRHRNKIHEVQDKEVKCGDRCLESQWWGGRGSRSLGPTVQPAQPNGWALAQRTGARPVRNSQKQGERYLVNDTCVCRLTSTYMYIHEHVPTYTHVMVEEERLHG